MTYDPSEYWNNLCGNQMKLAEVGWPNWTEAYNRARYRLSLEQVSQIVDRLHSEPQRILEVGCGVGFWTRYLTERFPASTYLGIDLSMKAINNLREQYRDKPNVSFLHADASTVRLPASSYDLVICFEVLLHIVDEERWTQAIAKIGDALSPNGYALLSDPLTMQCEPLKYSPGDNCRVRKLTDFRNALASYELEILEIHPRTFFLDNNYDFRHGWASRCWNTFFRQYNRLLSIKSEPLGRLLGYFAYHFDKKYIASCAPGHSCKLTVIQHRK